MEDSRLIFLQDHFIDRLSAHNTILLDTMVLILSDIKPVVDGGGCTASFTERRLKKALLLLIALSS
jgi:hypothetical protein